MAVLSSDQERIRDILICCARNRRTISYNELGDKIGRPAQGPWREDLNAIAQYEQNNGRLDLTWVVQLEESGLPPIYKKKPLKRSDRKRVEEYRQDLENLFQYWGQAD